MRAFVGQQGGGRVEMPATPAGEAVPGVRIGQQLGAGDGGEPVGHDRLRRARDEIVLRGQMDQQRAGEGMGFIHDSGVMGIAFSVFVVVIAALNLVLDFDFIETGVAQGAPKYMEWYGAFALVVTLVWLYLEILRLLSKLQSRD